jgi:enamine deaminase RidA (YjgF/YER057c/UK114 family)
MTAKQGFNPDWPRIKNRPQSYNAAVKKGNMIFLSGISSADPNTGKMLGQGDVVAQCRQCFLNIKDMLAAAGATFDDVVKTTDYIVPAAMANYAGTGAVRKEFFTGIFPASTGVVVHSLLRPDMLIEIDVVAIVDK